jgi:hypothetical protein
MSERALTSLLDERALERVATAMTTLADRRAWAELRELFVAEVEVDYSRLSGEPAATVPADGLIDGWARNLGALTATQHLLGNLELRLDGDEATGTAYVQAAHVLDGARDGEGLWILGGRYRYRFTRAAGGWRIAALAFEPVWERGSREILVEARAATA